MLHYKVNQYGLFIWRLTTGVDNGSFAGTVGNDISVFSKGVEGKSVYHGQKITRRSGLDISNVSNQLFPKAAKSNIMLNRRVFSSGFPPCKRVVGMR